MASLRDRRIVYVNIWSGRQTSPIRHHTRLVNHCHLVQPRQRRPPAVRSLRDTATASIKSAGRHPFARSTY